MIEILRGVKNSIIKEKEVEDLAHKRLDLCKTCKQRLFDNLRKYYCNTCGCKLELKARSNSDCPKHYWSNNKVNENDLIK